MTPLTVIDLDKIRVSDLSHFYRFKQGFHFCLFGVATELHVANFWAPYLVRHEQIEDDGTAHTGLWNLYLDEPDPVWAAHVSRFDYVVVSA
jgi:hypothetical protein